MRMWSGAQLCWQQRLAVSMRRSHSTAGQSSLIRSESQHTTIWVFTAITPDEWHEAEAAVPEGSGTEPAVPGCALASGPHLPCAVENCKRRLPRCRRNRSRSGADTDWRLPIMQQEKRKKQMLHWRSTSKSIRTIGPFRLLRSTPTAAKRTKPSSGSSAPTNSATAACPK